MKGEEEVLISCSRKLIPLLSVLKRGRLLGMGFSVRNLENKKCSMEAGGWGLTGIIEQYLITLHPPRHP